MIDRVCTIHECDMYNIFIVLLLRIRVDIVLFIAFEKKGGRYCLYLNIL